jgi:hypothetical protein
MSLPVPTKKKKKERPFSSNEDDFLIRLDGAHPGN